MSRFRSSKASLTNKTSIFGIMGGLANTRNVNKTSRSTNRLTIPSTPSKGFNSEIKQFTICQSCYIRRGWYS